MSNDGPGVESTVPDTTAETLPTSYVDLAQARIVTPAAIAKLALRYEYVGTEELLGWMASEGRLSYAEIMGRVAGHAGPDSSDPAALENLTSPALYALAFLAVGAGDNDTAINRAADLFAFARSVAARTGAATEHPDIDIQTSFRARRLDYVRKHLDDGRVDQWVRWAVRADLANPFIAHDAATMGAWFDVFNEPFVERGIAPVRVGDAHAPFDTLMTVDSQARARTVDGPLVTIVVSVFKPSASLLTAVRSLVDQTWRNLQVIIVDDASPEEYAPVFAEARNLDERVEYVRMPANGGAYRARNHGVSLARGEFVGFQDADDWSHPERIERQLRVLADPGVVATLSKAVRLYSDLRITKPGSLPFEKNSPSLIFRREQVLDRLGRFDDMRKAADTEFIERLAAVYGQSAVVTLEEPLSLYQLTDGSLSRSDFRIGWHRDARVSYHSALRYWHRRISDDGAPPLIESAGGRAFPAPPEIEGVTHPSTPLDVVLLADFRYRVVESTGLPAEIAALSAAGLEVGLTRGEALRKARVNRDYPQPAIQKAVADGLANWRPLSAELSPRLLLVRDADLLMIPRTAAGVRMRPERIVVTADRLPFPDGTPRVSYDPRRVEQIAQDLFMREVEWLPASDEISEALLAAGAVGVRHPARLAEIAEVTRRPRRLVAGRPIIAISDASKFGAERIDRRNLGSVLPVSNAYDVRILESSDHAPAHPGPSWLSYDPMLITPTEVFDQSDFYVGLPPKVHGTRLTRPAIDAMSRGAVPLLHPVHRQVFGDAALYYGERSVQQLVDELWADPARFEAAQNAALAFCHNELSAEVFASTITRLTLTELSS